MRNSKGYFPNLDGPRTIACVMVFMKHGIVPAFHNLNIEGTFFQKILFCVGNGETGVSIFFVLSGFLITFLILKEIETNGKLNIGFFYIRRMLRIWPLYYGVILFSFVIYPELKSFIDVHSHFSYNPIYYFLFLSNFDLIHIDKFFPNHSPMFSNITWSVAVEEQFYLVWPLLFILFPKRFFKYIFLLIIAISLCFRLVNYNDDTVLYFHSLSVCGDLALGGIAAYYAFYSDPFISFFKKLSKPVILTVYICGFTWLLFESDLLKLSPYSHLIVRIVSTLFFAFVILEQNYCRYSFFKFSESRLLTHWGKYTYSLYLLHPIALLFVSIAMKAFHVHYKTDFWLSFLYGCIGFGVSLLMSYVSFHYFESWFLKLKDRFTILEKQQERKIDVPINEKAIQLVYKS